MAATTPNKIRLQKRMAQLGVASRRESERLIAAGRVAVNGQTLTTLGTKVSESDTIVVDGKEVGGAATTEVWVLNKPRGVIVARSDPQGRSTVYGLLPPGLGWMGHVGRLDYNTEGLLLFTNDGELTQRLLAPSNAISRVYMVKLRGKLTGAAKRRLEAGIDLDGRPTKPISVEKVRSKSRHDWLRVTLFEGKSRHVHRIMEAVGHSVTRLIRVGFGGIDDHGLEPGDARRLNDSEVAQLNKNCG